MRVDTLTILLSAVLAIALPSISRYKFAVAAVPDKTQTALLDLASLPEFVSPSNRAEFLLAAGETTVVSPDARKAAESLSTKFDGDAAGSKDLGIVVSEQKVATEMPQSPNDQEPFLLTAALSEMTVSPTPEPDQPDISEKVITRPAAILRPRTSARSKPIKSARVSTQGIRYGQHRRMAFDREPSAGARHPKAANKTEDEVPLPIAQIWN